MDQKHEEKKEVNIPGSSRSSIHDEEKLSTADSPVAHIENQPAPEDVESKAASAGASPSAPTGPPGHGHVNDLSSVPNGGLRAWLQVVGAFMLFFNTWYVET